MGTIMSTNVQYLGIGPLAVVGVFSSSLYVGLPFTSIELVMSYIMLMMPSQYPSPLISLSTSHMIASCPHHKWTFSNSLMKLAYHMRMPNSSMGQSWRLLDLRLIWQGWQSPCVLMPNP